MKTPQIKKNNIVGEGGGENVVVSVDMRNAGKLQWVLRDMLYKFPLKAAIWETLSNALDEEARYGCHKSLLIVTQDNHLVIRDYAKGLPDDQVVDIFFRYLSSTKDSDNNAIGCFGVGANAPSSYAQQWYVASTYGGYRTLFMSTVEDGMSVVKVVDKVKSDSDTGIEVVIPIDKADIDDHNSLETLLHDIAWYCDRVDMYRVRDPYSVVCEKTDNLKADLAERYIADGGKAIDYHRTYKDGTEPSLKELLSKPAVDINTSGLIVPGELIIDGNVHEHEFIGLRSNVYAGNFASFLLFDGDSMFTCAVDMDKLDDAAPYLTQELIPHYTYGTRVLLTFKRGELTVMPDRDSIRADELFYAYMTRKDAAIKAAVPSALEAVVKRAYDSELLGMLENIMPRHYYSNVLGDKLKEAGLNIHDIYADWKIFRLGSDNCDWWGKYVSQRNYYSDMSTAKVTSKHADVPWVVIEQGSCPELAACSKRSLFYAARKHLGCDCVVYILGIPLGVMCKDMQLPAELVAQIRDNYSIPTKALLNGVEKYKKYMASSVPGPNTNSPKRAKPVRYVGSGGLAIGNINDMGDKEAKGLVIVSKADRDDDTFRSVCDYSGSPTPLARAMFSDMYGVNISGFVSAANNSDRKKLLECGAVEYRHSDLIKAVNRAIDAGACFSSFYSLDHRPIDVWGPVMQVPNLLCEVLPDRRLALLDTFSTYYMRKLDIKLPKAWFPYVDSNFSRAVRVAFDKALDHMCELPWYTTGIRACAGLYSLLYAASKRCGFIDAIEMEINNSWDKAETVSRSDFAEVDMAFIKDVVRRVKKFMALRKRCGKHMLNEVKRIVAELKEEEAAKKDDSNS